MTKAKSGGVRTVTGWLLGEEDRDRLLARFPATYPSVIAHHVTLTTGTSERTPLPEHREGEIVGEADDGAGVQALVVRIGGTTDRPDGSTYHITWSLDRGKGRRPVESNDVIRKRGWKSLGAPVRIALEPARFSS